MIPAVAMMLTQGAAGGVTGYRYYRFLITANNGHANYVAICEVELRGTVGGSDLTSPGAATSAATASDDQGTGFWIGSAVAAFDNNTVYGGNEATRAQWLSNDTPPSVGAPKWLKYDFGTPTTVAEVALTASHTTDSNPSTTAPKDFKIQGSNDNSTWTDLASPVSQAGWTPAEVRIFAL